MNKNYQKLTPRILEHILVWGNTLCRQDGWTKSDTNIYAVVEAEAKRLRHKHYEKRKAIKVNPYIDSKQPYPTT